MNSVITYRPEINGLRALAVISVLIYHTKVILGKKAIFLSGGFLGVDVFFVISGYLITLIILREINAGTFTFINFYKRRAKRILPALFLVLLVSIPLAWWTLFPADILQYHKALVGSIFFYSNHVFRSEDLYMAHAGIFKPLLHTWSLAVEEQYYLLIPLIILPLARFWKASVIYVFALLFILSFSAALYQTPKESAYAFYLLPFRLWELMAGGLLAAIELKWGRNTFGKFSYVATALGFLGLLYSFSFVTDKDLHPYWLTLIPIASTAAIIWFSTPKDPITELLSTKIFVGIGLISYSLYLWHYPLFSFGRSFGLSNLLIEYMSPLSLKLLYISIAFLLAALSYRFVEQPFRTKKIRAWVYILLASFFALAVVGFGKMLSWDGSPERLYYKLPNHHSNQIRYNNRRLLSESWWPLLRKGQTFVDKTKTNVLLIGDSHSNGLFNAFHLNKELYPNFEFIRYANSPAKSEILCYPSKTDFLNSSLYRDADIIFIHSKVNLLSSRCSTRPEKRIKIMREKDAKRVVLFSRRILFKNPRSKFPSILKLKFQTPLDHFLLRRGDLTDKKIKRLQRRQYKIILNPWRKEIPSYKSFAKKLGIEFVDITPIQCDFEDRRCDVLTDEKKKIYYDTDHWTTKGGKYFGKKIFEMGLHPLNTDTPPLK